MENSEKEIIKRNMDKLVKVTICNTGLLTNLLSSEMLSEEDIDQLMAEKESITKAFTFYRILLKRKHAFKNLLQGLEKTNQTGALEILTQGEMEDAIPLKYDKKSVLGRGSYGTTVYRGTLADKEIAVKMLQLDVIDAATASKEIEILKTCDAHDNIVSYFGSKTDHNFILILLELCDMSLKEWVEKKTIVISPLEVLRQVTTGLEWLHSQKIVHRDLKPENILLVKKIPKVKISDFGLSRRIVDGRSCVFSSVLGGTQGWVAPEILAQVDNGDPHQCKFTFASDVFALGCVYYYVFTDGKHAFGDSVRVQANILDNNVRIDLKQVLHCCVQNILFVRLMISNHKKSRPSCSSLLSSPLFWSINQRLGFLEHFFEGDECSTEIETLLQPKWNEPCVTEHDVELEALQHFGVKQKEHNGCIIPAVYLQCRRIKGRLDQYFNSAENFDSTEVEKLMDESGRRLFDNRARDTKKPSEKNLPTPIQPQIKSTKYDTSTPLVNEVSPNVIEIAQEVGEESMTDNKKQSLEDKQSELFTLVKSKNLSIIMEEFQRVAGEIEITKICNGVERSLLHVAVMYREYDVVEYLVNDQGFENVLSDKIFEHTLIYDCMENIHKLKTEAFANQCKILEFLFTKRPQLIESREKGTDNTPLHVATSQKFKNGKHVELIQMLFKYNADVNAKDYYGNTPLHLAVECCNESNLIDIIRLLVTHGTDPDAVNSCEETFLHVAARCVRSVLFHEIVEYLAFIQKTESFTAVDMCLKTVLHWAAYKEETNFETLEILYDFRFDFNATDKYGNLVIFEAIRQKRSESYIKALIHFGADRKIKNNDRENVLHIAAYSSYLLGVKFFISLGCNINSVSINGDTPLHKAMELYQKNYPQFVTELLNLGADPSAKNYAGKSPIDYAKQMDDNDNPLIEQGTVKTLEDLSSHLQAVKC